MRSNEGEEAARTGRGRAAPRRDPGTLQTGRSGRVIVRQEVLLRQAAIHGHGDRAFVALTEFEGIANGASGRAYWAITALRHFQLVLCVPCHNRPSKIKNSPP